MNLEPSAATDYVPLPATKVIQGDFRPRVLLACKNRTLDNVAGDLAKELKDKPIFNHGGIISILDDRTYSLQRITPTKFRSWIESDGGVVCQAFFGRATNAEIGDASMREDTAKAVLDSPRFIRELREVVRVNTVRLPVRRDGGAIELLPAGYDPETKILTIETVKYDEAMDRDSARDVFVDLLKDTAFDPRPETAPESSRLRRLR